jgi:CubicO group peptidase (beta-lactamase class C family)/membrane protein YqaA with SNARE-associated domain
MSAVALAGRRMGWADVACIGGLVVCGLWYLAMIPVFPSLIGTHPVLLEALAGSLPSEIAAGAFARIGRVPLLMALAAPVTGLMAFDPFWWWAGRRYGDSVIRSVAARSPRSARSAGRGLRLFHRYGGWTLVFAYYLPVPNNLLYAAAGWAGFGFLRFIVLDLIGTMLRIVVDVGLGYALGSTAAHAAGLISRYCIAATVALTAAVMLAAWWRRRRGPATPPTGADPRRNRSAPPQAAAAPSPPPPGGTRGQRLMAPPQAAAAAPPPAPGRARRGEPPSAAAALAEAHLRPLVDGGTVPGLVYAVVTPGGPAAGHLTRPGSQPLGPHVMLEIGSVTKVFTALLLADMAERGEVTLDDPIARHLPTAVAQACPAAARITLRQLATHTSGLPRLPRGLLAMALRHPSDPYAGYSAEHLYRALSRVRNQAPAPYRYSNFGFGLLGQLLSHTAGRPYGQLLAERVTGPLGLTETSIDVPDGHAAAAGHRGSRPAARWHLGALAGAGALNSTAADLARFLSASLRPGPTSLRAAIETAQRPHPSTAGHQQTGLGWHISAPAGRPLRWHNGGTGGFSAMLALDRPAGYGVGAVGTASPTRHSPLDGTVLAALAALTDRDR